MFVSEQLHAQVNVKVMIQPQLDMTSIPSCAFFIELEVEIHFKVDGPQKFWNRRMSNGTIPCSPGRPQVPGGLGGVFVTDLFGGWLVYFGVQAGGQWASAGALRPIACRCSRNPFANFDLAATRGQRLS